MSIVLFLKNLNVVFNHRLSDDIEQTEENGNKRIKLLNEINKENFQEDHEKEKSVMDVTLCESKFCNI